MNDIFEKILQESDIKPREVPLTKEQMIIVTAEQKIYKALNAIKKASIEMNVLYPSGPSKYITLCEDTFELEEHIRKVHNQFEIARKEIG